jgi:putative oxidoreductase
MKSIFLSASALASDFGLLILRLFAGCGILTHGYPKLQKVMEGNTQFADPLGIGQAPSLYLSTAAEFVCAILILLGLFTRISASLLIINLAVAFFIFHSADSFGAKEMPLMYLGMFLTLFFTGPGKYSLDRNVLKG